MRNIRKFLRRSLVYLPIVNWTSRRRGVMMPPRARHLTDCPALLTLALCQAKPPSSALPSLSQSHRATIVAHNSAHGEAPLSLSAVVVDFCELSQTPEAPPEHRHTPATSLSLTGQTPRTPLHSPCNTCGTSSSTAMRRSRSCSHTLHSWRPKVQLLRQLRLNREVLRTQGTPLPTI